MGTVSLAGHRRGFRQTANSLAGLLMLLVLLSCCAVNKSQSRAIVYSRLGDSGTRDSATCGQDRTQPCRTIGQAISNAAASPDTCTAVQLLSSRYDEVIVCENLTSVSDVLIDGSEAGTIQLRNTNCSDVMGSGFSSWIMLWNVSDVTLQHLNISLVNFTCDGAIVMQWSHNITIQHSTFGFPRVNTSSILSMDTKVLRVWACEFYGAHIPDPYYFHTWVPQYRIAAIQFRRSCQFDCSALLNPPMDCCVIPHGSRLNAISPSLPNDMWLGGCAFHDFGIERGLSLYSNTDRYQDGISLHINLLSVGSFAGLVENCTFTNLTSPYDTVLKLYTGRTSNDIQLTVKDSTFRSGYGFVGAGLLVRADDQTTNLTVRVSNCNFSNNAAIVSGGAIAVAFAEDEKSSSFNGPHNMWVEIDGCHFEFNHVGGLSTNAAGGAISATSRGSIMSEASFSRMNQKLPTLRVSNSLFVANTALIASGMFVAGFELDIANSSFTRHEGGSAIMASASWTKLGRNVKFENNSALRHGGAMSLVRYSVLTVLPNGSVYFGDNNAAYGGALYADSSSSTTDIAEVIQYMSSVGVVAKRCFLQSSPGSTYSFNSSQEKEAAVVFKDNRSPIGNAIFAHSYTACLNEQSPMLPNVHQSATDVGEVENAQVTSGPVWIIFKAASCDCYKENPQNKSNFWLYQRGCDRHTIYVDAENNSLFNSTNNSTNYFHLLKSYTRHVQTFLLSTVDVSGYGVIASPQTFVVPWGISNYQWLPDTDVHTVPNGDAAERLTAAIQASAFISSLYLYPAPGEMFTLEIDLADVYFNVVDSPIWGQIVHGDALIIYNSNMYSFREEFLFVAKSPVVIGIAGRPGEEGTLLLTTSGQLASSSLQLYIPFRLRPCHTGFSETEFMLQNTTQAIHEFAQRFKKTPITNATNSPSNQLMCQCPSHRGVAGVLDCVNGTDIRMDWWYWAGQDHREEALSVVPPLSYLSNITAHEAQLKSNQFLTSICYGGFCSDHGQVPWNVRQDRSCVSHRKGTICGSCAHDYAVALAWFPICVKCDATSKLYGRLIFFLIFIIAGVVLFIFSYFEIGRSAVFESWVNFEQFCLFITRREITFWTLMSYSPPVCVIQSDNVLEMTAALYVVSVAFAFWLVIVFQLSRIVAVRRFIINNSLITGMWAVVTFSYAYMLLPSFNLLACRHFDDRWVMFYDASIPCFGSAHWPWGLLALFALLGVVIPIPVVLIVKKSSPRVKPLVDVYLSYVKDDRHWYIAFTMLRRLVVCGVSVFVVDPTRRQVTLAVVMQLWLFLHFIIQPYRRKVDNAWEALFLGSAGVYAILNILPIGASDLLRKLLRATYLIPACAAFAYGFYYQWRKMLTLLEYLLTLLLFPLLFIHACAKGKPFQRLSFRNRDTGYRATPFIQTPDSHDILERAKTVYSLRDNLLVDVFEEPFESSSTVT